MSAFIMHTDEINVIVSFFIKPGHLNEDNLWTLVNGEHNYMTLENAELVAAKLYSQNVRSVNERYNEETVETYQFTYDTRAKNRPAGNIIGALDCYEYQACETDDWHTSLAHEIVQGLRKHLLKTLAEQEGTYTWGIQ